ncbi:MAG: hypothetical protein KDE47_22785, partial [Caldilineaceae bacterium]|nr:hypothetical protein [Caldilineaceae bacterium]
ARMTMLRNDHDYWFLYEGTPGGTLETAQDTWTRADGQSKTLANQWTQDLVGPEWIYFSDPDVEGSSTAARSLFLVQHQENSAIDTYYPFGGLMTVFGFGRNGTNRYLTTVPQQFTFGLMETTEFSAASTIINNAYRDLGISVLPAEVVTDLGNPALTMQNPLTIRLTSNRTITANFE